MHPRICALGLVAFLIAPGAAFSNPGMAEDDLGACEQIPGHPKVGDVASHGVAGSSARVGDVIETMTGGGYTYALLDVNDELVWVAGPETTLETGAKVITSQGALMADFHSRTLDRSFSRIWFVGTLQDASGSEIAAASTLKTGASVAVAPVADGTTVADLIAGAARLNGREVELRATVVKVTANVMSKNWLHLQDGSGSEADGTHDLTITSADQAEVGDVVVVRGMISADRDFGAGYHYDVIMENASIRTN